MSNGTPPPPPGYGPPPGGWGGYGGPSGYGEGGPPPPPGQPVWGYQGPPQTSTMAILSMVAGIVSIVGSCLCCGVGVAGIAAIVLGILGQREIRQSNGAKSGSGMAIAGIVTGVIGLLLTIGLAVAMVALSDGFSYYDSYSNI